MPLDLLTLSLSLMPLMRPVLEKIALRDPDLARQARKALTSIPLNVGEGRRRKGRDRPHLFAVALGSAAELGIALEVAVGFGYLEPDDIAAPAEVLDRIRAMAWRCAR